MLIKIGWWVSWGGTSKRCSRLLAGGGLQSSIVTMRSAEISYRIIPESLIFAARKGVPGMDGDMESNQSVLARRSARIVLALLVAVVLFYVALLTVERSGPNPVRSFNKISSNSPTTQSPTIQSSGVTVVPLRNCNDNDNNGEGGPLDNDGQSGECTMSGG
jgi:hypothetical protein